jgi:hypothetical protein
MANEWYCQISGTQRGPFDDATMRRLAASRKIDETTPVRKGSGEWVPVVRVRGLFTARTARITEPTAVQPPPVDASQDPRLNNRADGCSAQHRVLDG